MAPADAPQPIHLAGTREVVLDAYGVFLSPEASDSESPHRRYLQYAGSVPMGLAECICLWDKRLRHGSVEEQTGLSDTFS